MKRTKPIIALVLLGTLFRSVAFCADQKILYVGISPTDPPVEFWKDNKVTGLEADFAEALGKELDMKIQYADMKFDELIPTLLANKIDVIMAGMSITKLRGLQIAFTEPYMRTGQMALVRTEDKDLYKTPMDVVRTNKTVGTKEGTTGKFFLLQEFNAAQKRFFTTPDQGLTALKNKKIDIFILDAPYIEWLANEEKDKVTPLPFVMTEESVAWGVRKPNEELLAKLNAILAKWKASGQLDQMIKKWIPNSF